MAEIVCGTCGTNDGTHERWCAVGRRITEIAAKDRRIAELEAKSNDFDAEMAIAARALTAAFEDGRLNANDKRNGQLSDIAESKKWQTEQVDSLNRRIAELEAALKYELARFDAVWHFCSVEMGWEYFREEYFSDSTSAKNASQLMEYLKAHPLKAPLPTEALDALLAKAKLAGWQEAISSVRASLEVYPNGGGDILIMASVEKLIAQAKREAFEQMAQFWERRGCKVEAHEARMMALEVK